MNFIDALARAIATFEGYFRPGTVANRNNNPGNLRAGPRAVGKDDRGYAVYRTPEDGWEDLRRQIRLNIERGLTLREFFGGRPGVYPGYAPAADRNQPEVYASWVGKRLGIPLDRPLAEFAGGPSMPELPELPTLPGEAGVSVPAVALAIALAAVILLVLT